MVNEQDIINRCTRGDEHAFAELVDCHKVMVFNIVDRMVPNSDVTEDLAQDVFLRVYRGLPSFQGRAKLSTWIYQIAYRTCLEELGRSRHRQTFISLDEEPDDSDRLKKSFASTTDHAFEAVDAREAVDHWLAQLPPHYQMVLNLYYLLDKSYQEIADVMDLPIGTVKTHLHRAKQHLKHCMQEEEGVIQ